MLLNVQCFFIFVAEIGSCFFPFASLDMISPDGATFLPVSVSCTYQKILISNNGVYLCFKYILKVDENNLGWREEDA